MSERVQSQAKAPAKPASTPARSPERTRSKASTVRPEGHEHSRGAVFDPANESIAEPRFGYDLGKLAAIAQTKLAVNQTGDSHEHEADQVADKVLRMAAPDSGTAGSHHGISHKAVPGDGSLVNENARIAAGGVPLDRSTRDFFEPRFGHDFSQVRIHSDSNAAETSKGIGAHAFTVGQDIWFGAEQYRPDTFEGKKLIAHELTHVIQQGKETAPPKTGGRRGSIAASVSAAPKGTAQRQPVVPAITAVNPPAPAHLGIGAGARNIEVTATVVGRPGRINWLLVGAPAGVTINPGGRRATVRANTAAIGTLGATFQVRAVIASTGVGITSGNITLVGVASVVLNPAPAFGPQPRFGGGVVAPPVAPVTGGIADPNRDGVVGNTANAVVVTSPVGRANTLSLTRPLGSSVAGTVVTPGSNTGIARVRSTDNATRSRLDVPLTIQSVPLRVRGFGAQIAIGPYGAQNRVLFRFSDNSGTSANRAVAETITAGGRDDFGFTATVNSTLVPPGPNPIPDGPRSAPANGWFDNLLTGAGAAGPPGDDLNQININRFVGPGVAAGLPRVWILRQGFHFRGWGGAPGLFSNEIDDGIHRRSLVGPAAAPQFRTEHRFPGGNAAPFPQNYNGTGPPLITLSAFTVSTTVAPALPLAAGGLAADGAARARATVATTVAGRNVNWSVVSGAIGITVPALGAAQGVAAAATIQAGLVPGRFPVRVSDAIFPNRRVQANVRVVAVRVRRITAPVRRVPVGVLSAVVNVTADPGGRTINWSVDPVSFAAGVRAVPVVPGGVAAQAAARTANINRPAAFTGRVRVTAADSVRPAVSDSMTIIFR